MAIERLWQPAKRGPSSACTAFAERPFPAASRARSSVTPQVPVSKRQKYPCELPERERELCRGQATFACPGREVAGKRGPRSGKSILGSAGARPAQASGHGASWERVQETTGFVQRKNEAAAARRVTFTLEQDDTGTVWAVADTWPAVACPCRAPRSFFSVDKSSSPGRLPTAALLREPNPPDRGAGNMSSECERSCAAGERHLPAAASSSDSRSTFVAAATTKFPSAPSACLVLHAKCLTDDPLRG
ncbi:hypothetical protein A306_00006042 [Columba livia]|uniref:Uncharacterized protein n=1 Tax=Columba livia TaxID=8932 RepID=A0A2I0M387_COLLI|nr:hypothetical protein A306_00006042 [Columba livia]